jgi:hypothetical protein
MLKQRGNLAVLLGLLAVVAVEIFALRSKTLGIIVLAVVAALAAIVVASRADPARIGLGAAYLSAFTLTWNGWYVGPVRPGDVLVLVALLCFAAGAPITVFHSPPWWIKQLVLALVLGVVLIVLFPPDLSYLVHRVTLNAAGAPVAAITEHIPVKNIGVAAKFIVAVAAIPIAYTAAAVLHRRAIRWLAISCATGSAVSGLVAFIDHTGIAEIGHYLTHIPQGNYTRAIGFSYHPNFLAAGLVLAIPFACWMLTSRITWEQRVGAACLAADLLGVYASGSRGGAVCAVGAVLLTFAVLPRTRVHLPAILLATAVGVGIIAVVFPSFGQEILRVTRLAGNPNTSGSDQVRTLVGDQGMADFRHSPIHGIGLQVSTDASQVYLQELASGGLILFLAMSIYMLGAAWESGRLLKLDPLAGAIFGAVGATLALNIFEADLTDRFYYVPEAILVAMLVVAKLDRRTSEANPAPVRRALTSAARNATA